MPRHLNLRQIEAFKAVIEAGTVSRGAEVLNISQPAMSKLISHLEADTGLKLFDRVKGRLVPTTHSMRLYDEVERIFAGVGQVESAIDAIRREERGQIAVGVMPALSGSFIQRVTTDFLKVRSNVFCSIYSLASTMVVEWLVSRKLDVGLVSPNINSDSVTLEPFMELPLVCIMPRDHPLTAKAVIEPSDLDQVPFVSFLTPTNTSYRALDKLFETYKVRPNVTIVANVAPTVCELVAAGYGVALIHPLFGSGLEDRLVVRRFEPEILQSFRLCRRADNRDAQLVDVFSQQLRETAAQISQSLVSTS